MKYSSTCKYCKFKKDCENIKRNEVENCLFYREEHEYDNGERC